VHDGGSVEKPSAAGHGAAGTEDSPKTQTFAPSSRIAQAKDEREMSDTIGR
jgi:hypothetical protein